MSAARADLAQDLPAPGEVGRAYDDLAVEPAWAQQGGVEYLGAVGCGEDDRHPRSGEPVHLGEELVEGLLLFVVAAQRLRAPRARPMASSSSMNTIAGATFLAWSKRSRTRLAPTPTNSSMNSEAEMEKNGTWPRRDRPCQQRLAGARRARQQHTLGDHRAQPAVFLGVLQEVDDLGELGLDLVDPGHVVERSARPGTPGDTASRGTGRTSRAHPLQPPPARRVTDTSNQTSNNVGPKPNSSCCHTGGPASGGFALTDTLVLWNLPNRLSSANVGRCVVNRVTCSAAPPCGV